MDRDSSVTEEIAKDPIREVDGSVDALERLIIADELSALVRHELRNNLSSIHNAAFYLKRRTQTTHLWEADQRVPQFFTLIEELVMGSTKVLDERLKLKHAAGRSMARVPVRECVARAAACARVPSTRTIDIDAGFSAGEVELDPSEAAVAIRCLLENALASRSCPPCASGCPGRR